MLWFFLLVTLGFTNIMAQPKPAAKKSANTTTIKAKDSTMAKQRLRMKKKMAHRICDSKQIRSMKSDSVCTKKKDGTADMRYKANKTKKAKK